MCNPFHPFYSYKWDSKYCKICRKNVVKEKLIGYILEKNIENIPIFGGALTNFTS